MKFDPASKQWKQISIAGFVNLIGPLWSLREGDDWAYAILADEKHLNAAGTVHGGVLMSMADQALSTTLWADSDRTPYATLQFDSHFLAAVHPGDFLEVRTKILSNTETIAFASGSLSVAGKEVAVVKGVWKNLKKVTHKN